MLSMNFRPIQRLWKNFLSIFLASLLSVLGCSSNDDNQRDVAKNDSSSDEKEETADDLFGGFEYPTEDTLAVDLTARVSNTQVRCDFIKNTNSYEMKCRLVVVQFDGRELKPTDVDPNMKISWKELVASDGTKLGSCQTISKDKLTALCQIAANQETGSFSSDKVVVASVELTDGVLEKTSRDSISLEFSLSLAAGYVPSIPTSYTTPIEAEKTPEGEELSAFGPENSLLKDQRIINSLDFTYIDSACIRENKIYFSTVANIFWIENWQDKTANIKLYAGASSIQSAIENDPTKVPGHRLWVPLNGAASIYCAPSGIIAVDQTTAVIWKLEDKGSAKIIAGSPYGTGFACLKGSHSRKGILNPKSAEGTKPLDAKLACIGGVGVLPKSGGIVFAHSAKMTDYPDIYVIDPKADTIEHYISVDSALVRRSPLDGEILVSMQDSFRIRQKNRNATLKILGDGIILLNDYGHLIEVDLNSKSWKYLVEMNREKPAESPLIRGVARIGDTTYIGAETGIYTLKDGKPATLTMDALTERKAELLRSELESRTLEDTISASKEGLIAIQSFTGNDSPGFENFLIAEPNALRVLTKEGELVKVFESSKETSPTSCGETVDGTKQLLPFIADLSSDQDGNVWLAMSGSAKPAVSSESYAENVFDVFRLSKQSRRSTSMESTTGCIEGNIITDNYTVRKFEEDNVDNSTSSGNDGIALRQDFKVAHMTSGSVFGSGKELFYKKALSQFSTGDLTKIQLTATGSSSNLLDGILSKSVTINESTAGLDPETLKIIKNEIVTRNFDLTIKKLSNFHIETPILAVSSAGDKLFVMTGQIKFTETMLNLLSDKSSKLAKFTLLNNLKTFLSGTKAGVKIVEITLSPDTPNDSYQKGAVKLLYASYPGSQSVGTIKIGSTIDAKIQSSGVWTEPWVFGSGGLDTKSVGENLEIIVTHALMSRVEKITVPKYETFDYISSSGSTTTNLIAGLEPGSPVERNFPAESQANENSLWVPWDLSVSANGDIYVAEAIGGGLKKIYSKNDGWYVRTILGKTDYENGCTAGATEKSGLVSGEAADGQIRQSASRLCRGMLWGVSAFDNCSSNDDVKSVRVLYVQSFLTNSNVVEIRRSCGE